MGEMVTLYNVFKPCSFKTSTLIFSSGDFLQSLEKGLKNNQLQKNKVHWTIFYSWIKLLRTCKTSKNRCTFLSKRTWSRIFFSMITICFYCIPKSSSCNASKNIIFWYNKVFRVGFIPSDYQHYANKIPVEKIRHDNEDYYLSFVKYIFHILHHMTYFAWFKFSARKVDSRNRENSMNSDSETEIN